MPPFVEKVIPDSREILVVASSPSQALGFEKKGVADVAVSFSFARHCCSFC
jgi:hypothetical protein